MNLKTEEGFGHCHLFSVLFRVNDVLNGFDGDKDYSLYVPHFDTDYTVKTELLQYIFKIFGKNH